jgi:hypothetical protein
MLRLLTPADFHPMPWKNGAGRTIEIAVHPAGATLDAFDWRVSIAEVERDGPFSRFPGVDRTIVLLAGAGMRLRSSAKVVELATRFMPEEVSGDDAIECILAAGPCRDFNAMFRRGRARGRVAVACDAGMDLDPTPFRLVYAATGTQECIVAGRPSLRIDEGHAVLVGAPDYDDELARLSLRPITDGAVALVVSVAAP